MNKIELNIEGMHCTGCSQRLQKILNNLDGISNAEVIFDSGIAKIEYDEKIKIEDIKEAVEDAGFIVK